ncbi:hypothetical protein GCM10027275_14290 [Rhabdobacter roseus]|uniref:Uncharacterized protein n=1 Tax=Rhabdobacter roseus TaxID=1655419 RepID=A0A840TTJ0_9BACT|nr:hypothetical protein [Rhabdobacter roseus]MBB5283348.1 hypothetical protein [Rhabdobacter roseus]
MEKLTTNQCTNFEEYLTSILTSYNCKLTVDLDYENNWLECLIEKESGDKADLHLSAETVRLILETKHTQNEFEQVILNRLR